MNGMAFKNSKINRTKALMFVLKNGVEVSSEEMRNIFMCKNPRAHISYLRKKYNMSIDRSPYWNIYYYNGTTEEA